MILYKYMSLKAAEQVIANGSVGFSCLEDFNDPFECEAFNFTNAADLSLPIRVIEDAYKNNFSRKFAVLSLSKNPLNPLMWSHYGDSHFGVVLGINVDTANLNDPETSVIPAKFGRMIYVGNKYENEISHYSITELHNIGRINSFIDSNSNLLEKAFLYKSSIWSYEEEVRVVKNISNLPFSYYLGEGRIGKWIKRDIGGRPIYCFDIPKGSIESIFLGINSYRCVSRREDYSDSEFAALIQSWRKQGIEIKVCDKTNHGWELTLKDVPIRE